MRNQRDIVDLAREYANWIRMAAQPLGMLKFSEVSDALITPQGNIIPFNRRALEVQKLFNLTPLEFQKRFNAPADNALLSRGYIYVNGGIIQAGVSGSGLSPDQISLISQYLQSLPKNTNIEIILLKHDLNSFKLLDESPIYQGDVQGANDKLLNMPSQTGELAYQSMPNYQFVPQKGGVPKESPSGTGWKGQFRFPTSSLKFSDIVGVNVDPKAPKNIELILGRTHLGLPVVQVDGWLLAMGTDAMADKAAQLASGKTLDEIHRVFDRIEFMGTSSDEERTIESYYMTVKDLPKDLLRALGINRGYEGDIYAYDLS